MTLQPTDFLAQQSESFQAMRALLQYHGIQPGVVNSGDYGTTQRGAGANMSVDTAAGDAWVLGGSIGRQGIYHQYNDATLNTAVPAAHASLPRIDQLFLVVNDASVAGASNSPQLVVVQGTATSGATLDNRNGAVSDATVAVTYPNRIRLVDILVPAASSSVPNTNIRDRRPWSRGGSWRTTYTTANATNGTATLVSINNALQGRLECSGTPVRVSLQAIGNNNTTNDIIVTTFFVDGAAADGASNISVTTDPTPGGLTYPVGFSYVYLPTAGSHLFVPAFAEAVGGTATVNAGTVNPVVFTVEEIVKQNAINNTSVGTSG